MISKKELNKQIALMPEKFTLDELVERLILIDKVEKAETESKMNRTKSEKELENEMKKWFRSSGHQRP